jgi:hypothetical protein
MQPNTLCRKQKKKEFVGKKFIEQPNQQVLNVSLSLQEKFA